MIEDSNFVLKMDELIKQQKRIANALEVIALIEAEKNKYNSQNMSEYRRIANIKAHNIMKE